MSVYLGLDYGEKRIGVACSDELHRFAEPYQLLEAKASDLMVKLNHIVSELKVCEVVVGIPRRTGGELKQEAERALRFVDLLKKSIGCPVATWDERFTTKMADQILTEVNVRQENRKDKRDALAASIMLQSYLDFKRLGSANV